MNPISGLFHDIGNAAKDVVGGALHAVEGAGQLGQALLTLNPQKALSSAEQIAGSAAQSIGGAATLTPEGLAASAVMNGGVAAVQALSTAAA